MYATKEKNGIRCGLCPHRCLIREDQVGLCGVRKNIQGQLCSLNYGEVTAIALDPIEKKPLYHFKPGTQILSVGSYGCNLACSFCQNYEISQQKRESRYIVKDDLIDTAQNISENIGIAFTYNEPTIWFEYVLETARKIKENNIDLQVVLVTNGYIEEKPLQELLPYVDAFNIDLKAFNNKFYQKLCRGDLDSVLKTISLVAPQKHLEITTLLIQEENDSLVEVEQIAKFIASLNKDIPLHLSRYFPNYQLKNPPTFTQFMEESLEIAQEYLNHVYLGNMSAVDNFTYCPQCQRLIIKRESFLNQVDIKVDSNICPQCGYRLNLIL